MRLPKDPDNLRVYHVDNLMDRAWREFARYEARINFELPLDEQDEIYFPYRIAREAAVEVARYTGWRVREAEMLP